MGVRSRGAGDVEGGGGDQDSGNDQGSENDTYRWGQLVWLVLIGELDHHLQCRWHRLG